MVKPNTQHVEKFAFRHATLDDLDALTKLEETCFDIDRMSRRSIKWMIQKGNCDFIVVDLDGRLVAYILILYHRGTNLARIYSLAVAPDMRGRHLGGELLQYAAAPFAGIVDFACEFSE